MFKGRCTNLARDVELHYNEMNKLNTSNNLSEEQAKILNDRVRALMDDVDIMRK